KPKAKVNAGAKPQPGGQPISDKEKAERAKIPCNNFAKGRCRFGDKCHYLHAEGGGVALDYSMVAAHLPPEDQFPGNYYDVFEELGIQDSDSEIELDEEMGVNVSAASQDTIDTGFSSSTPIHTPDPPASPSSEVSHSPTWRADERYPERVQAIHYFQDYIAQRLLLEAQRWTPEDELHVNETRASHSAYFSSDEESPSPPVTPPEHDADVHLPDHDADDQSYTAEMADDHHERLSMLEESINNTSLDDDIADDDDVYITCITRTMGIPRHKVQKWAIDTGSANHLIDKSNIYDDDTGMIQTMSSPKRLATANGVTVVDKFVHAAVNSIQTTVDAIVMDKCPDVLSVGRLVMEDGFSFVWEPKRNPILKGPDGQDHRL
ncbi:MAG: hypothetical protein GY894_06235, partial [Planctomycetes bacterium]|nr:hypothetical protein [Planctomycetota bacterium]